MSDIYPETPLGSPPAQAVTPGQAAYEARQRSLWARHGMPPGGKRLWVQWTDLSGDQQADEDAAAAAVMLMAQATVDYAELQELREAKAPERLAKAVTALRADVAGLTVARDALGHDLTQARGAFAKLAGRFTQGAQSGWTARISGTVLRRLCVTAGVEPPSGTGLEALAEASELVAERDAHKVRADHYEGLWRAEHGLPPDAADKAAKPVLVTWDPGECTTGYIDDIAEAVRDQSAGRVIITMTDIADSDCHAVIASREYTDDEALALLAAEATEGDQP